jgi:predicted O-linked N-acetylglucosamine transferase (SPINDLY family)
MADLFLDTFPYNAGTTASDALWAGLPVLTRSGNSFPSRMAGSLLRAIGTPELITSSIAEYEEVAVELAMNQDKLALIQDKVRANRDLTALFDSKRTTKNIERAYQEIYRRYIEGKSPENIDLTILPS